jgi:hypothetical protein
MALLSGILTVFCFCAAGTAPPPESTSTLAVHVHMAFDRSITSKALETIAKEEAAAIWGDYGVELEWSDRAIEPAVCLDAFVQRHRQPGAFGGSPAVLAHTTITPGAIADAPILISFDAVDALLEQEHFANLPLHDRAVATALGRVLAHEIGHVLLGSPGYHDPEGLMRARFLTSDLVRMERSRFRLMEGSIARLRSRIASLSDTQPAGSCTRTAR